MTEEHADGAEPAVKQRERLTRDDSVPVQDFTDIFRVVARRSKAGFDKVHDEITKLYLDSVPALESSQNLTRKSKAKWWSSQPKSDMWVSTGSILESSFKSYITDINEVPEETSESDVNEYSELGEKIRRFQTAPSIQDNECKFNKIAHGSIMRPPRSADNLKPDKSLEVDLPHSAGNVKPKKSVFNFDGVSDFMEDDMVIKTVPSSNSENKQLSDTEDDFYEVPPMEIREVSPRDRIGMKGSARPASELIKVNNTYNKPYLQGAALKQSRVGSQYGRFPVRSTLTVTKEGIIRDQAPQKPTQQTSPADVDYDVPMKAAIKVTNGTKQDYDNYDVPVKAEIKVTKDTKQSQRAFKPNKNISKNNDEVSKRLDVQIANEQPDYDTLPVRSDVTAPTEDDIYDVPKELIQTTKPNIFMQDQIHVKPKHSPTNTDVQHKRLSMRPAVPTKPKKVHISSITNQSVLQVTHEEVDYDEIPHRLPSVQGEDTNYENVTEKQIKKKKDKRVITMQEVRNNSSAIGNKQCTTHTTAKPKTNSARTTGNDATARTTGNDATARTTGNDATARTTGNDATAYDGEEDYLDMGQTDGDYVNTSAFAKHKLVDVEHDTPIYMEPDINAFKK